MSHSGIRKTEVGERIRSIRLDKNLTLEEFGKLIGNAEKSNVSKWERGLSLPNKKRLQQIAELGNTTVNQLLYGDAFRFSAHNIGAYLPAKYKYLDNHFTLDQKISFATLIADQSLSLDDSNGLKRIMELCAPYFNDELVSKATKYINSINDNLSLAIEVFTIYQQKRNNLQVLQNFNTEDDFVNYIKFLNGSSVTPEELVQSLEKLEAIYEELQNYVKRVFKLKEVRTFTMPMGTYLDNQNLDYAKSKVAFTDSIKIKNSPLIESYGVSDTVSLLDQKDGTVYVIPYYEHYNKIELLLSHDAECFVVLQKEWYLGKLIDENHLRIHGTNDIIDISENRILLPLLGVLY